MPNERGVSGVGASGAASAQAGAANPWECPIHPGAHYMLHYDGRKYCYYCLVEAVARDCDMPIFAEDELAGDGTSSMNWREAVLAIIPMVEAYRLWTVGKMSASEFGRIADVAIVKFDGRFV